MLVCYPCEFRTNSKSDFINHVESKQHLEQIDFSTKNKHPNKCVKCFKTLSNVSSKKRHERICKGILCNVECQFCKKILASLESKSKHQKICQRNPIHARDINTLNQAGRDVNNITNIETLNINVNIPRNKFTQEDLTYMSKDEFTKFMQDCVKSNFQGILDFINEVYLNKDKEENNTIRKYSENNPFIEFFNGEKWIKSNQEIFMQTFFDHLHTCFQKFLNGDEYRLTHKDVVDFMKQVGIILKWDTLTYKNFQKDIVKSIRFNEVKARNLGYPSCTKVPDTRLPLYEDPNDVPIRNTYVNQIVEEITEYLKK